MKLTGSPLGEYQKRKIEAEKTSNLPVRHTGHKTRVYFLEFEGCVIGLTHVSFSTYEAPPPKTQRKRPSPKKDALFGKNEQYRS